MKRLLWLSFFICSPAFASVIVNPGGSGSGGGALTPGDTNYIQNTNSLQSGATFFVSSGSVNTFNLPNISSNSVLYTDVGGLVSGTSNLQYQSAFNNFRLKTGTITTGGDSGTSVAAPPIHMWTYNSIGQRRTYSMATEHAVECSETGMKLSGSNSSAFLVICENGVWLLNSPVQMTFRSSWISNDSGDLRFKAANGAYSPLVIGGANSQTVSLIRMQGRTSTTSDVEMAEIDGTWIDSTHATRKAQMRFGLYEGSTLSNFLVAVASAGSVGTTFPSSVTINGKLTATLTNVKDQWNNADFILNATTNAYYTTTSTHPFYGRPQFSASFSTATNNVYLEWHSGVDFDTNTVITATYSDFQGGVDTSSRAYIVSISSFVSGNDVTALTFSNPIALQITNAASGGIGRVGITANTTLTGWNTYIAPSTSYMVRIARQGDSAALDTSTITSYFDRFMLFYGRRQ
jgi:hypothetical protein